MCILPEWITAFSTVGMLVLGWGNYELYKQAQEKSKQERKDFEDILEALVVSTLLSGPGGRGDIAGTLLAFREHYKGERQLFRSRG